MSNTYTQSREPSQAELTTEQLTLGDDPVGKFAKGQPIPYDTKAGAEISKNIVDELLLCHRENQMFDFLIDMIETLDGEYPQLSQTHPELYRSHQELIARGRWLILDRWPVPVIEQLFREYFQYFFDYEWADIDSKTRLVLSNIALREERDTIKQRWSEAIATSQAVIGDTSITVNESVVDPTVQNWVEDFNLFLDKRTIEPLHIVEYLGKNGNVKAVNEETQEHVESVLRFIEILNRSSLTPEGAEETFIFADPVSGHFQRFDRGEIEDTGVALSAEELEAARYVHGLDDEGRPKSVSQRVQDSPLFVEGAESRYASPKEAETEPAVDLSELTSPPTEVVPLIEQETEAAHAPEEKTVVEPVLPDEKLVPPPPADHTPELPTMQVDPIQRKAPQAVSLEEPVPPTTPVQPAQLDYNALAREVVDELKIMLPSLEMEKRFLSVLSSYFRGVRDTMETQEALRQTEQEGGVDLAPEYIQSVMEAADNTLAQAKNKRLPKQEVPSANGPSPVAPTLSMVQERMKAQHVADEEMGVEQPTEQVQDIFSNVNPIFQGKNTPVAASRPQSAKPAQPAAKAVPQAKRTQRMMSPLDELRGMDLTEFRRLAGTPKEAAKKVLNIINLLAEESLSKKADGVAAWKASDLHKQYVDIGNRSLESGQSVDAVISSLQSSGAQTLTQDEFDAIADMNKTTRF
jgi:hypothetical protein